MQDFEKLGVFYLGRVLPASRESVPPPVEERPPLLLDARELTTHAVVLGMTGSGKTGLCLALLEEAAIDGVPAIAIDPKGDLGNLLLTFPDLRPEDFRPYVDEEEARRESITPEILAARTASEWRQGLAQWGQDGARIGRMRAAADVALYTPGGSAGLPLSLLRPFSAPPTEVREDTELFRERIMGTVSGLLALLGIEADLLRSREQAFLSALLTRAWEQGEDLDLGALVRLIQTPPLAKVGVLDLESFYPARERAELALRVNNLLASPGFAAWMEGEPLDVGRLLYTPDGKPRISILSMAHLQDSERMFFVTLLLQEVIAWMRAQSGTSSLRALLYMDEIFGYFPPTANPPSKTPMLTLFKQARAFGLGVVVATQNPVDLDYKGLSNAGLWFLGRLQTERDQARVLDGLEAAASSSTVDRARLGEILSGLQKRQFLVYSARGKEPAILESRWTLSYLRGPLSRNQIRALTEGRRPAPLTSSTSPASPRSPSSTASASGSEPAAATAHCPQTSGESSGRPVLPAEVSEFFLPATAAAKTLYSPMLLGAVQIHYVSAPAGLDLWERLVLLAPLAEEMPVNPWEAAFQPGCAGARGIPGTEDPARPDLRKDPAADAGYLPLPPMASRAKSYTAWSKALTDYLFRTRTLQLWRCPAVKEISRPGESEGDFKIRISAKAREGRDGSVDALRKKYDARLATLLERIRRAEERVVREQAQFGQQQMQTVISVGSTLLGAFLGGGRRGSLGGAASAARGATRAAREKEDIAQAQSDLALLRQQQAELEGQLAAEVCRIQEGGVEPAIEPLPLRPRKADLTAERVVLVWVPEG